MAVTIYNTAYFSLILQLVIGIICLYGITFKVSKKDLILNELLILETVVQFIELVFYILLIYYFSTIKINLSVTRYFDWFITTPIMLFTIIGFMIYKNQQHLLETESRLLISGNTQTKNLTLKNILNDNFDVIFQILLLNALTLVFGLLGELKKMNRNVSFFIGSLLFSRSFYLIYENYVNDLPINKNVFWFNFVIWAIYGIAYLFSYTKQNIAYNILDLFSKNINGLLIFAYIYFVL